MSRDEERLKSMLMEYITPDGKVDYGAIDDTKTVGKYIEWLKNFNPDTLQTRNEKLAFWINTYNLLTICSVIRNLKEDPGFAEQGYTRYLKRVKFFWCTKKVIGGKKYSLYQIENRILRKMNEPRIHFALNCASASCPLLKDGLYSADTLEQELESAAHAFIQSPLGVVVGREDKVVYLSRIFKWYRKDFKREAGSILEYIKEFMHDDDRAFLDENMARLSIRYLDYAWDLNIVR